MVMGSDRFSLYWVIRTFMYPKMFGIRNIRILITNISIRIGIMELQKISDIESVQQNQQKQN